MSRSVQRRSRAWLLRTLVAFALAAVLPLAASSGAEAATAASGKAAVVTPNGDQYMFRNEGGQLTVRVFRAGVGMRPWEGFGGSLASGAVPQAVSWGNGRVDVFVRWSNGNLFHLYSADRGDTWSAWEQIGSWVMASDPSPITWGSDRIDVFARGTNNDLIQVSFGSSWGTWTSLGGSPTGASPVYTGLAGQPSAISWRPGHLDVFARAANGRMWHRWFQNGAWSAWSPFGQWALASDPAAIASDDGKVDVFAVSGAQLIHAWFDGTKWNGFETLGGSISNVRPSVVSWGSGHLDAYTSNSSGDIFHRSYKPATGWAGWEPRGFASVVPSTNVDAISYGDNHIDLTGTAPGGTVTHSWYVASGWSGWENLASWNTAWKTSADYGGANFIVDTAVEQDAVIDAVRAAADTGWSALLAKLTPADLTRVTQRMDGKWPTSRTYGGANWKLDLSREVEAFVGGLQGMSETAAATANTANRLESGDYGTAVDYLRRILSESSQTYGGANWKVDTITEINSVIAAVRAMVDGGWPSQVVYGIGESSRAAVYPVLDAAFPGSRTYGGSNWKVDTPTEADALILALRAMTNAEAAAADPVNRLVAADRTYVIDRMAGSSQSSSRSYGGANWKVDTDAEADAFITALRASTEDDATTANLFGRLAVADRPTVTTRVDAAFPSSRTYGGANWTVDTTAEGDALITALRALSNAEAATADPVNRLAATERNRVIARMDATQRGSSRLYGGANWKVDTDAEADAFIAAVRAMSDEAATTADIFSRLVVADRDVVVARLVVTKQDSSRTYGGANWKLESQAGIDAFLTALRGMTEAAAASADTVNRFAAPDRALIVDRVDVLFPSSRVCGGANWKVDTAVDANACTSVLRALTDTAAATADPIARLVAAERTYVGDYMTANFSSSRTYGGANWKVETTSEVDPFITALRALTDAEATTAGLVNRLVAADRPTVSARADVSFPSSRACGGPNWKVDTAVDANACIAVLRALTDTAAATADPIAVLVAPERTYVGDYMTANFSSSRTYGGANWKVTSDAEADAVISAIRGSTDAAATTADTFNRLVAADRDVVLARLEVTRQTASKAYGGANWKVDTTAEIDAFITAQRALTEIGAAGVPDRLAPADRASIEAIVDVRFPSSRKCGGANWKVDTDADADTCVTALRLLTDTEAATSDPIARLVTEERSYVGEFMNARFPSSRTWGGANWKVETNADADAFIAAVRASTDAEAVVARSFARLMPADQTVVDARVTAAKQTTSRGLGGPNWKIDNDPEADAVIDEVRSLSDSYAPLLVDFLDRLVAVDRNVVVARVDVRFPSSRTIGGANWRVDLSSEAYQAFNKRRGMAQATAAAEFGALFSGPERDYVVQYVNATFPILVEYGGANWRISTTAEATAFATEFNSAGPSEQSELLEALGGDDRSFVARFLFGSNTSRVRTLVYRCTRGSATCATVPGLSYNWPMGLRGSGGLCTMSWRILTSGQSVYIWWSWPWAQTNTTPDTNIGPGQTASTQLRVFPYQYYPEYATPDVETAVFNEGGPTYVAVRYELAENSSCFFTGS